MIKWSLLELCSIDLTFENQYDRHYICKFEMKNYKTTSVNEKKNHLKS